ncbi:DNA-binding response regulator [Rhizorhabdus dicambivorans]|uniref:DNA-binding response regulator n=2 Tax=Rhizorhabdus dicambivorans TaxID=1850238 RepID=A0A2A4FZJ1_9SPHN|nr:DNA-binding response regulator [Rhizorhabdus dicambivorans]PCE43166.1 DNA-binding response regulator [Rhizorhabdus dicambivorans]
MAANGPADKAAGDSMRIAVLDDEATARAFVTQTLIEAGHFAYEFPNARTLVTRLRQDTFDLVILDWNMPDKSGPEIITWMRENMDKPVPSLLLTNRNSDADIVAGLDAGADDYVIKPVQPPVLLARIAAIHRRTGPREATGANETYGPYQLQPARQTVIVDGETIVLTAKEFELAATLFRNMHRPLSRSYLLEIVWGRNPDLPTRTLDAHISRIRAKLGIRPERGFRLVPVYSYGYRLEPLEPEEG